MTNLQGCINFLLPPGPKFIRTSHHCFLQSVLFLELSWGRHDFIVSNCIGHNGIGLWTSNKDSDVMGLVLASTLASNVRSDSSFRLVPCILSSANNTEWPYLIWRSQTPPLLLAVGGFLFHWIHWPPGSSMNSLIFLCFISENVLFSSALAPTNIVPLSVLTTQTLPLLDTDLWSAFMKVSDSIWIELLERHVKRHYQYLFIC